MGDNETGIIMYLLHNTPPWLMVAEIIGISFAIFFYYFKKDICAYIQMRHRLTMKRQLREENRNNRLSKLTLEMAEVNKSNARILDKVVENQNSMQNSLEQLNNKINNLSMYEKLTKLLTIQEKKQ